MSSTTSCVLLAICIAVAIPSGDAIGMRSLRVQRGLREPVAARSARAPILRWITQPVDHFNTRDNRTWSMRYYENDQFLSGSNPPILIMLGGEWEITTGWLQSGQMFNIASAHGAIMYYTEHRYYGGSRPTEDTRSENLQYLNVDQALADVAYFIEAKKKERGLESSKVVVFGGSYAGNMATWARLKYPHLIQGALASSAPVFAKADFYEYYEVVTEALRRSDSRCPLAVNQAFESIEELLRTPKGPSRLSKFFQLCEPLDATNSLDVSSFAEALASSFAGVVQYDEVDSTGKTGADRICDVMTSSALGSPLQRLAYLTRLTSDCRDVKYRSTVEFYSATEWESPAVSGSMRSWLYQTCAEYGYYQTANSNKSVFGSLFTIETYHELCKDLYGDYYTPALLESAVKRTNIVYGGNNPDVRNIIFANGDLDPWHVLSVLEDVGHSAPAIVVPDSSHCQDLYGDAATDSAKMTAAKARIRKIVGEWIAS
ncbi:thymus-specific serine protease-like [Athalia rosae]|uniref:thymus-specific serine protease-like n=1 Tax=Athalia rosae TaxID=37344 RepID=UPI002033CC7C|nr:thymus-specific serine protease-like [Athalia rosae]